MNPYRKSTDGNCPRCSGRGYLPQYKHVQGGVCFRCGGDGEHNSYQEEEEEDFVHAFEKFDYDNLCSNDELSGWGGVDFDTWFELK